MEITNNYNNYSATEIVSKANHMSSGEKVARSTQEYLNELKQKYPNVNITVADFKSDKQKLSYMMGSSGLQNLAVSGQILEKMAKDSATAAKYESLIAKMPEDAKETKEYADEHNMVVYGSGMIIDKNGKVSYWEVAGDKEPRENPGAVYKDKLKKQLEENRAEKKKQNAISEKKAEKKKQAEELEKKRVEEAETREKLHEKMKTGAVSQESVIKAAEDGKGAKIDFFI